MLLNGSTLNQEALNAAPPSPDDSGIDWETSLPIERQAIYLLTVDDAVIPMSSFQATMRASGKSFLQAVVPVGAAPLDALAIGKMMRVQMGYRYDAGKLSPLETIAAAPLQVLRSDEGPIRHSITLSGYDDFIVTEPKERALAAIMARSINQGDRRIRCMIDLFLRPGHTAIDSDGSRLSVATIQYFVNAASEAMEVIEDGQG